MPEPAARSPKAEQTRRAILDAAMRLFRRDGYDRTTMRAVAQEAGVSVGNAYYYFASKEHLVQAFYDQVLEEHAAAAADALRTSTVFAAQFFRTAADPRSPLSPFSAESGPAREASVALYARLVEGTDLRMAADLRRELPFLLWLLQMGIVLFWVHDGSEGQRRSHELVDGVVTLMDRTVRLSRLPVVRGVVDDALGLVRSLRG